MAVYFGNQKAKQLVYVDANGVQHNVKEAYLGSQLVFSGKKKGFTITNSKNARISYRINGHDIYTNVVANEPTFVEVKDTLTSMENMFYNLMYATALDVSGLDTKDVTTMYNCFRDCESLTSLDLSTFVTSNVINVGTMFSGCKNLVFMDLSGFDLSHITTALYMGIMFQGCTALTHIKCKQAFKDWCWANATTIELPTAMQEGGSGTWEIVG